MNHHELYMQRALDLAKLGYGQVSPNPLVGCVIVKNKKIIAEGYHKKYGGHHAEIEAINNIADKKLLQSAELYVNLEPCSHYGKTPPCAKSIVKYGFSKVYIANTDPNPLVAGKGIRILKEANIVVIENILSEKGYRLNRYYFHFIQNKSPYIILKWAITKDNFLARSDYNSKWISNWLSRKLVHKWRSEIDAILIGTNTALYDNPELSTHSWIGKNPIRIVIDKTLRLKTDLQLFDQTILTFCYNLKKNKKSKNLDYIQLEKENFLENLLANLYEKNIQTILVEGGSKLLNSFLQLNLWQELRIFQSQQTFGEGIKAPNSKGILVKQQAFLNDELKIFQNNKQKNKRLL